MLLTGGFAWELGPYNIRVNAIAPGGVRTEMLRPLWSDPETLKEFESGTVLGRMAEPADIASVALFLASDGSGYITGQTIIVDGGFLA
jgi:NAD(P)-dependent dehydrogenase (short-subunit alcohol dehydrogenase family)